MNLVAPGFIDTDETERLTDEKRQEIIRRSAPGRLPQIDYGARADEFLLSNIAKEIAVTVLTVNAGDTA